MNAEIFAEWFRRHGYVTVRTASTHWAQVGPRVFQAIPYHWQIQPTEDEFQQLFQEHQAVGLRFSTPLSASQGMLSYHVIYTDGDFCLEGIPKKARHDVRKALKHVKIEPVSFEHMAAEGWRLRAETLARQGRTGAESQAVWQLLCRSAQDLPGFETWAASQDGQMSASLIAFNSPGVCSILYQQSRCAELSWGVNNGLVYAFMNDVFSRANHPEIFYGLHSLDAPDSVDRFKFRMGFCARAVRQRIIFNPRWAPLFNPVTHAATRLVMKIRPDPAIAKVEGMLRFYLQGQRPLDQQTWPRVFRMHRDRIDQDLGICPSSG